MFRPAISVAAIASVLAGCATPVQPVASVERDTVDSLITASAQGATQALRDLSETTGNSRVVVTSRAEARPVAGQTAPAASSSRPVAPTPAPMTIAGRSAPIAVDTHPVIRSESVTQSSSGSVSSGGLLSVPPAGLERVINVRWTGELEQLLAKVAQEVGWAVGEPSGRRIAPVIISINAENRSAFDVLRDIGAIAGTSADIRVSAASRTVSVRYPTF